MRYRNVRRGWIGVGLVALALLGAWPGAAFGYEYTTNIQEALASGQRFLEQRKLADAQVDFENVILMDPGNETAHLKLFEIYLARNKVLLAQRILERIKILGKTEAEAVRKLEADLKAKGGAPASRAGASGGRVDPDTRMLDLLQPDERLQHGTKVVFAAFDETTAKPFGSEPPPAARATKPRPTPGEPPKATPEALPVKVSSEGDGPSMAPIDEEEPRDADGRFKRAVTLAKKSQYTQAIPLYVRAIQEKRSLMMLDDCGLLQLSREAYIKRLEKDPQNANLHFLVGFFHEQFSEYGKALQAYEKARDLAPKDSKLHTAARDKVVALKERERILADQMAREQVKAGREAALKAVERIERGEDPNLQTGEEYFKKGSAYYQAWITKKNAEDLKLACAHLRGAIAKEPGKADYHFKYAVMMIDQASLGDRGARDAAKVELEKTLALNPDATLRNEAETLLRTLTSTAGGDTYQRQPGKQPDAPDAPGAGDGADGTGQAAGGSDASGDEDWDFEDSL